MSAVLSVLQGSMEMFKHSQTNRVACAFFPLINSEVGKIILEYILVLARDVHV